MTTLTPAAIDLLLAVQNFAQRRAEEAVPDISSPCGTRQARIAALFPGLPADARIEEVIHNYVDLPSKGGRVQMQTKFILDDDGELIPVDVCRMPRGMSKHEHVYYHLEQTA